MKAGAELLAYQSLAGAATAAQRNTTRAARPTCLVALHPQTSAPLRPKPARPLPHLPHLPLNCPQHVPELPQHVPPHPPCRSTPPNLCHPKSQLALPPIDLLPLASYLPPIPAVVFCL
eukprot:113564-Chlamydomonas_euryale.AAC.3